MGMRRKLAHQLECSMPRFLVQGDRTPESGEPLWSACSKRGTSSKRCPASISEVYLFGEIWIFWGFRTLHTMVCFFFKNGSVVMLLAQ